MALLFSKFKNWRSMKKVLITGASGYIGKHITLRLLNEGYSVRASVRNLDKSAEVIEAVRPQLTDASNLNERLTFVQLDLENDQGWSEALLE
jgi:dihydroflavonol-4-reductase